MVKDFSVVYKDFYHNYLKRKIYIVIEVAFLKYE